MKLKLMASGLIMASTVMTVGAARANGFINGGFEDGTSSGWTRGAGYRGNIDNPLSPADFLPGGSYYDATTNSGTNRSAVISAGYTDPNIPTFGSTIYSGAHSFRVEDTTIGGFASVLSQTVTNYTDPNIFFAYKAVLENGGHSEAESATFTIALTDVTKGTQSFFTNITANPTSAGPDPRFTTYSDFYYTPTWQIVNLAIDASDLGDTFRLDILAADCEPTGHTGYVYIDGFGAVTPPVTTGVPEPETLALIGLGVAGSALARRRRKQ